MLDKPALFQELFEVYSWYKRGYLPDIGSILDQAAAFVQLVTILEQAVADAKAIKEKIDSAKAAQKNTVKGR